MNVIDVLLAVIVLLAIWSGWQKGFILGVLELAAWLGSLLIGFLGYEYVARLIEKVGSLGVWTLPVAFIITIIIARFILSAITNRILAATSYNVHEHAVNHFLGVFPGFVKGMIYATLVAALLLALPLFASLTNKAQESEVANRLAVGVEWLDARISPVFDDAVSRSLNKLTVHPKSGEMVKLPYTVKRMKVRDDLEMQMLQLINDERKKEGLKPLKADPELASVARSHSKDMFVRGYFSHVTPEGKTPSDRIKANGVRFITAGENLALGQTLKICHTGLMNSPGHRANILQKAFGRVGIGIQDGGIYGLMITQNFRN